MGPESIGRASQSLTRDRDASMWNAGDLSFLRVAREVPAIAVRAAVYREPVSPVFLAGNQGRFCLGAACVAVLRLASLVAEGCVSAWAQYALLAKDTAQRDAIVAYLKEAGIPNMIYYPTPQHALPVFRDEPHYGETFHNADDYCARTFSLPMHPYLEEAEQRKVIDAVLEGL